MCSKLEGIFKHIRVSRLGHKASSAMAFKVQEIQKISKIHETLLNIMAGHQDGVVEN